MFEGARTAGSSINCKILLTWDVLFNCLRNIRCILSSCRHVHIHVLQKVPVLRLGGVRRTIKINFQFKSSKNQRKTYCSHLFRMVHWSDVDGSSAYSMPGISLFDEDRVDNTIDSLHKFKAS